MNKEQEVLDSCENDEYSRSVQCWAISVPIGLGLCPWAMKSKCLLYRTCRATAFSQVTDQVKRQAHELSMQQDPLSSTLLVCPHVIAWKNDWPAFESFVKGLEKQIDGVTLVAFHPEFLKWRALPKGIKAGSRVHSYMAIAGFQKSTERFPATVVETVNPAFGLRKIKLHFAAAGADKVEITTATTTTPTRAQQYVPMDWLEVSNPEDLGPPLPDNAMHRAPHATIHIIRNQDLAPLSMREVSRVKRLNAHRMRKLGWQGIEDRTKQIDVNGRHYDT